MMHRGGNLGVVRSNALVLATAAVAVTGCASSEGTGPGQTMAGGTAAVIAGSAGAGTSGASLGGALGGGGALGAAGGGAAGNGAAGGGGGAVGAAGGDAAGGSGAAASGGGQTGDGGTAGGGAGGGGGGAGGAPGCMPVAPATDGTEYCANGRGLIGSSGYSYELWSANAGSGCMRVPAVEGNYSATWTAAADFLARTGLVFDATKKHAQVGTITAQFEHNFTEVPVQGATSKIYVALYGWTLEPLMEYYVIEDHGDFVPGPTASDGSPRTNYGSLSVDDGTYDIWALPVKNRPSIIGDSSNFTQIFNVRRERRKCGKISVSEHLAKWDAVGLTLGKLEEAMFLMEAQNNSGTISVKASVTVK